MRLLLVSREYPPHIKGGMCKIAQYMARYSRRYDVSLTIVANHPYPRIVRQEIDAVMVYRVPSFSSTFLTQLPSFACWASAPVERLQDDFDVVYSNYSPLLCKINRPFIAGFHATRYGQYMACKEARRPFHALLNRLYIPFDKLVIKKADGIVVLSQSMAREIEAMGGANKTIEIIPGGVDTSIFTPFKSRNFSSAEKRILYVGRLDATKDVDILFCAFKRASIDTGARIIVVGDGRERRNLVRLADLLSIPVQFMGNIAHEEMPFVYNDADLFVLPSLREGFPLAALEAMACATPTIVSNASPDLGVPAFERGSVEGLARSLFEHLSSEAKLKELSQKALDISREYTWERTVGRTFAFLREFVSRNSS